MGTHRVWLAPRDRPRQRVGYADPLDVFAHGANQPADRPLCVPARQAQTHQDGDGRIRQCGRTVGSQRCSRVVGRISSRCHHGIRPARRRDSFTCCDSTRISVHRECRARKRRAGACVGEGYERMHHAGQSAHCSTGIELGPAARTRAVHYGCVHAEVRSDSLGNAGNGMIGNCDDDHVSRSDPGLRDASARGAHRQRALGESAPQTEADSAATDDEYVHFRLAYRPRRRMYSMTADGIRPTGSRSSASALRMSVELTFGIAMGQWGEAG